MNYEEYKKAKELKKEENKILKALEVIKNKNPKDYTDLLGVLTKGQEKILKSIPEIDNSEVLEAINSIPEVKDVDLAPLLKAIESIESESVTIQTVEQDNTYSHEILDKILEHVSKKRDSGVASLKKSIVAIQDKLEETKDESLQVFSASRYDDTELKELIQSSTSERGESFFDSVGDYIYTVFGGNGNWEVVRFQTFDETTGMQSGNKPTTLAELLILNYT